MQRVIIVGPPTFRLFNSLLWLDPLRGLASQPYMCFKLSYLALYPSSLLIHEVKVNFGSLDELNDPML